MTVAEDLPDASPVDDRRRCAWCREPLGDDVRADSVFCSRKCRQTAFRLRRRGFQVDASPAAAELPKLFAYADPPYPGLSSKYYRHEESYAGEVDHRELLERLTAPGAYDGWALSTSARALRMVLPLCPEGVRVCSWVKPIGAWPKTYGLHNTWEPLLVFPGRHLRPGMRDWLRAAPARGGGELPGRKPIAFCAFLFDALGMLPGDLLDDLYPKTGVVSRAWRERTRRSSGGDR